MTLHSKFADSIAGEQRKTLPNANKKKTKKMQLTIYCSLSVDFYE